MNLTVARYFQTGQLFVSQTIVAVLPAPSSLQLRTGVTFKADSGNTGICYFGGAAVSPTTGYPLRAGEQQLLAIDNLSGIFFIANTNNNKVFYTSA